MRIDKEFKLNESPPDQTLKTVQSLSKQNRQGMFFLKAEGLGTRGCQFKHYDSNGDSSTHGKPNATAGRPCPGTTFGRSAAERK